MAAPSDITAGNECGCRDLLLGLDELMWRAQGGSSLGCRWKELELLAWRTMKMPCMTLPQMPAPATTPVAGARSEIQGFKDPRTLLSGLAVLPVLSTVHYALH
ncbi:uncharacterized protein VDAG_02805 [Verticillium dahliae VdLs.17]|uniref:Uncharacterized protein n=1 Tax=Verticillium dahliae (strain VdLs.17 / ATCC MYA-4575 / FGSC 10137) TaxID=498257 RepID=G2WX26_VERDV|nr:uncharacterized protein VDAG_02805 [Verticillium dahliae VdLs.17]EGY21281.1 hypothetical protein VDAG_02805 [Verticillium dahliae VdLs.17]KAH6707274.1 hypothetical protein EV126DRAFT_158107 [Verticillium dahliae]